MHKLNRHKENDAAVLLAVCVMSGNGFTCHIMVPGSDQNVATKIKHEESYNKSVSTMAINHPKRGLILTPKSYMYQIYKQLTMDKVTFI
jgi:hypothetical protein